MVISLEVIDFDYNLDSDIQEEGLSSNLISIALGASLLAMPGILKAKDLIANAKNLPTKTEFQAAIRNSEIDKHSDFGGYTKVEAANIIARTIFKEGRSEGHVGRHYIATVIYNRAGKDVKNLVKVCFKPSAFSVWNAIAPSTKTGPYSPGRYTVTVPKEVLLNDLELECWNDAKSIASELVNGNFVPDGTYNSYYAPKKTTPSWASSLSGKIDVGKHRFGYLTSEDPARRKLSTGKKQIYTVSKGDLGVSFIAKKFLDRYQGETVQSLTDKIINANNFKGENPVIRIGQKIILPPMT